MNNGTVWKHAATSTSSVLVTVVVAWYAFGGGVTAAEVQHVVTTHAATIHDKAVSRDVFDLMLYEVRELNKKVDRLLVGQQYRIEYRDGSQP